MAIFIKQLKRGRLLTFQTVLKYYLDSLTSTNDMHLNIKYSFLTLYTVNCSPVEPRCPSLMGLTLKTQSKQTCKQCSYQIITQACLVHRLDYCFLLALKSYCFSKLASPNLFLLGLKIWPPMLNSLSTGALKGSAVLYLTNSFVSFGKTMYSVKSSLVYASR